MKRFIAICCLAALSAAAFAGCGANNESSLANDKGAEQPPVSASSEKQEEESATAGASEEESNTEPSEEDPGNEPSAQSSAAEESSTAAADESSAQESAAGAEDTNDPFIIDETDPHKSEKLRILARIREVLVEDENRDPATIPLVVSDAMNEILEESNIEFTYSGNAKGLFGKFSDDAKWGFQYADVVAHKDEYSEAGETSEDYSEMLAVMKKVDARVKDVCESDEYKSADAAGKRKIAEKLLEELASEKLIKEGYLIDDESASFEYGAGGLGGIRFTDFDPMMN